MEPSAIVVKIAPDSGGAACVGNTIRTSHLKNLGCRIWGGNSGNHRACSPRSELAAMYIRFCCFVKTESICDLCRTLQPVVQTVHGSRVAVSGDLSSTERRCFTDNPSNIANSKAFHRLADCTQVRFAP